MLIMKEIVVFDQRQYVQGTSYLETMRFPQNLPAMIILQLNLNS